MASDRLWRIEQKTIYLRPGHKSMEPRRRVAGAAAPYHVGARTAWITEAPPWYRKTPRSRRTSP
jgi:hypothetical protein